MNTSRSLRRSVLVTALFIAACLGILVVLLRSAGVDLPGQGGGYEFQAVVPDAVALAPGSQVRSHGVTVGKVVSISAHAGNAVILARLDDGSAPVYRDGAVQIRLKSLVGENYLDVDRGRASAGAIPSGGVLPMRNSDDATQLDQILSTLDPRTRRHLQTLLQSLGGGVAGRGDDLNRLIGAQADAASSGADVTTILASRRNDVAALINDLGTVMRAVAARGQSIQAFARGITGTSRAVAARDQQLAATIRELPGLLDAVRRTTPKLGDLSASSTGVVNNLTTTLQRLNPVVHELPATARETRATLAKLSSFAVKGRPLLRRLGTFSSSAGGSLSSQLDRALAQAVPALAYLSPYYREAGAFFANERSATSSYDAVGHIARVVLFATPSSLAISTQAEKQVLDALYKIGALHDAADTGNNQYPKPGEIAKPGPFSGKLEHVTALPPLLTGHPSP